jgi:diguanylate cyclase (GGDEF)-like protein
MGTDRRGCLSDGDELTMMGQMPADNQSSRTAPPSPGSIVCLSAAALAERFEEEINRAGRHNTQLSCLLVVIENLDELTDAHGSELSEQTLVYVGEALRRELRRFDRVGRPSEGELAVLLPGADGPRGEVVARRTLARLRAIKVEADGERRPLRVSVGLAAWREDVDGEDLLAQARAAARREHGLEAVET